ncbi:MAG: hypothetical protein KDJ19_00815 [Hyphomicrobiaceae bacterium]|nr:hypothetical protein [Hyphomicrobiaceae bacterium]MCC0024650.1 hypothetical protein [Hyphomicrobiaceae bacterium]
MRIAIFLAAALFALPAPADELEREFVYQVRFCEGMHMGVDLGSVGTADCTSDALAIEVGFFSKWKEDLGQSLAYAAAAGLRPGMISICDRDQGDCYRYDQGLQQTAAAFGLALEVWECLPTDMELSECHHLTLGPNGGQ